MIPFNAQVSTRYGPMLVHRLDQYVGQSLDRYGEFSPDETDFLCALVGPGSIVVDGGANLGALTVPLAQRVGRFGQVWAIEPQRLTFQALCANVAGNSLPNVLTLHAALGRAPDTIRVPDLDLTQPQNVGGFALKGHDVGRKVPVVRIDDLGLTGCTLLKLDLEGMERDALAGAKRVLREYAPLLYVEADRVEQFDGLVSDMKQAGYRVYRHHPPLYRRRNWRNEAVNVFGEIVSINLLGVPPQDMRDFGLGEEV